MKQVFRYDDDGSWLPGETLLLHPDEDGNYDIPEKYTEVMLPQPNWKPVFNGKKWVETITQEELDELNKPIPQPLSEIDKLKISQAEQFETLLMLIGGF